MPTAERPPLSLRGELARKAIHLATAAAPVAYSMGLARSVVLAVLGMLLAAALLVERARSGMPAVRRRFDRLTAGLVRIDEARHWTGATWLLVAFVAAVAVFPRRAAVAAMWAVSVGDASAAIIGRTLGRTRFPGSRKTLEGTLACALSTATGAWALAGIPAAGSAVAGLAGALAELPDTALDDNLRVTAAVGGIVVLWTFVPS